MTKRSTQQYQKLVGPYTRCNDLKISTKIRPAGGLPEFMACAGKQRMQVLVNYIDLLERVNLAHVNREVFLTETAEHTVTDELHWNQMK